MYRVRPQRRGATIAGSIAVAIGLSVAAGCTHGEPKVVTGVTTTTATHRVTTSTGRPAKTATTSQSTTTTADQRKETASTIRPATSEEQLVIDRYNAFWEARTAANASPPNPDDPRLRELATGPQLVNVIAETKDRRVQGLAIRNAQPSIAQGRVRVRNLHGDVAEIQECSVDDGIIYRPATGEIVNDEVVTRSVAATMRKVDGVWRLETTKVLQQWKGVAGCAKAENF